MHHEDCPFKVVRTNGGDEVVARAANLLIGKAAFETAKRTPARAPRWRAQASSGRRLSINSISAAPAR